MKTNLAVFIVLLSLIVSISYSESIRDKNIYKKYFIGSDLFMLTNLAPELPHYYRLNFGYRITSKDVILIEVMIWDYSAPIGIPYGSDKWNVKK